MAIIFEINKPFPIPVPLQEGAIMELWEDGLIVAIQMPNCTQKEINAFRKSFKQYSYLETKTPIPIAIWVFNFPMQFGEIDVNFNARVVKAEYLKSYLDTKTGIKNLLTFFLLDRQILKCIKVVGLKPKTVTLFHETIKKQLAIDYTKADYDKYLNSIYHFSTKELFDLGIQFNHTGQS